MGRAYIKYQVKIGQTVQTYYQDLGTVVSISTGYSKKTSITPIVSRPMRDAFPIETGNSQTVSISFKRVDTGTTASDALPPTSVSVSRLWSNKKWYSMFTEAIDRWQARTDGCMLYYESDTSYVPAFDKPCYIKNISRTYKNDFNEVITGTIDFTVGTMYVNDRIPEDWTEDEEYSSMQVMMSSPAGNAWYLLMAGDDYSCIDSVMISAGSEQSFEYADISIPKKKLMEYAPALEGNIHYGMNKVSMSMMGEHNMIVAKVDTGDSITLRAYCMAWLYESAVIPRDYEGSAWNIIHWILTDASYGLSFDDEHIIYSYSKNADESTISIPAGDNVWRVLQICAYVLRCKIFFADNKAYVVDYTSSSPSDSAIMNRTLDENIEICRDFMTSPITLFTNDPASLTYKACTGKTKLGKEGIDPLRNYVTVRCKDTTVANGDQDSISVFGKVDPLSLEIPELTAEQAETFIKNYTAYLREPQRSITFTLKEVHHRTGEFQRVWRSFFGNSARAAEFIDEYSGESISNRSMLKNQKGVAMPQKLTMSSYKRHYPRGITEYTFGTISEISLPANTSQVNNALNSKG